jgi:hypothetical protein
MLRDNPDQDGPSAEMLAEKGVEKTERQNIRQIQCQKKCQIEPQNIFAYICYKYFQMVCRKLCQNI